MKYGISWRSFVFPVERFLGAFFCFLWNEMLRTLPTSLKKENNNNNKSFRPLQKMKINKKEIHLAGNKLLTPSPNTDCLKIYVLLFPHFSSPLFVPLKGDICQTTTMKISFSLANPTHHHTSL